MLTLGLLVGAGVINAQVATTTVGTTTNATTNPMSNLVTVIAQKFNLNASDVQTVVDETRKAEHANMQVEQQQRFTSQLTQAVSAGALTQAQADLITQKVAEVKTSMQTNQTDLQTWATANNIPKTYLRLIGGG